ncbi:cysteine proteinases superfamily protein [Actinidia rufa]|nr:cysteine proteinases superfamily protein [Actinidia rufa]
MGIRLVVHLSPPVTNAWGVLLEGGNAMCRVPIGGEANRYLKNKIKPEEKHRFHFFNSFFFRKLADLDKDPSRACKGRAAFQRVRKWTRKVNLFEKDYIFIPVNFSLHWSLIVICHPGDMANTEGKIYYKFFVYSYCDADFLLSNYFADHQWKKNEQDPKGRKRKRMRKTGKQC